MGKNGRKFIDFGSIEQFRHAVKSVTDATRYIGKDDDGNPIFNTAELPKITAIGTEKIHGTNAAACYSHDMGIWFQSKNNIIEPTSDNAGCAFAGHEVADYWHDIFIKLANFHNIDLMTNIIAVYYEWCGGNIQKNSCVSGLDKRAIIFKYFKVQNIETSVSTYYETVDANGPVDAVKANIYNVATFPEYSIEIDFNYPELAQNELSKLTLAVEESSGIAKYFEKPDNIGEGIVWTFFYKDVLYRFKTKGEKHSTSKVTTLEPVDLEAVNKKIEFVNIHAATPARLEQAWQTVFGIENEKLEPAVSATGAFLKAVMDDVIKEESDIMMQLGLEPNIVAKTVNTVARKWFMDKLNACK